ncbi:MAG: flavodoxin family protein [Candidatus Falkowbacteria bacterium]
MKNKKVLIICTSIHHGNTLKIAKVMAEVLGARIMMPADVNSEIMSGYDLIGFGSGIYNQQHHSSLFDLLKQLSMQDHKKAFVFSTNTFGLKILNKPFVDKLIEKGFDVLGDFSCPGFMNYSVTKYFFGGFSKNRPNENDLKKARDFSGKLWSKM